METAALLDALPARLGAMLDQRAARTPQAHALYDGGDGRHWTYLALARAVADTAALLRALALRPGDRLMAVGENCAAQVALTFAAASVDAWIVHVNSRLSAREVDQILHHCGARRVFYTAAVSPQAAAQGQRHQARRCASVFGDWMIGEQRKQHRPTLANGGRRGRPASVPPPLPLARARRTVPVAHYRLTD